MSDKTGIEWADATWNPITGCTKVSPGCDNCYAKTMHERFHGKGSFDTVTLTPRKLVDPLRWRKPRRIFVNSMSDLFHKDVTDGMIAAVWFIMGQSAGCIPEQYRGHTFQILTKRHARMRSWMREWADTGDPDIPPMDKAAADCGRGRLIAAAEDVFGSKIAYDWMDGPRYWPTELPGVWLGVSVETQQWADIRIPALLDTPAVVRFISAEPLLGPVDLCNCYPFGVSPASYEGPQEHCWIHGRTALGWVIAGGESGSGARPMHPNWARSLRDQCSAVDIPFLFKQFGEWTPYRSVLDEMTKPVHAWEDELGPDGADTRVCRLGKKAAGRTLDGRTWDEYPAWAYPLGLLRHSWDAAP